jgi:hypothetical protein
VHARQSSTQEPNQGAKGSCYRCKLGECATRHVTTYLRRTYDLLTVPACCSRYGSASQGSAAKGRSPTSPPMWRGRERWQHALGHAAVTSYMHMYMHMHMYMSMYNMYMRMCMSHVEYCFTMHETAITFAEVAIFLA